MVCQLCVDLLTPQIARDRRARAINAWVRAICTQNLPTLVNFTRLSILCGFRVPLSGGIASLRTRYQASQIYAIFLASSLNVDIPTVVSTCWLILSKTSIGTVHISAPCPNELSTDATSRNEAAKTLVFSDFKLYK